ncbi:MAG: putative aminoglycoside phosphotransferase [Candidatus Nanosalina sp. J07AB43]|nr:MAG: putative aminoglycoside phosphotransferase [Candidatus Nanosalina sp. J07AB43]
MIKYASGVGNENNLLKGYRACEHVSKAASFKVPEPVKLVVENNELLAIEEKVDTDYPSRQDWNDSDFLEQTVHKGAQMLNEMYSDRLSRKIQESGVLVREDRIGQAMEYNLELLSSETDNEIYRLCKDIISAIENTSIETGFSHNDFNIDNMIFEQGHLTGLFDWENCGLADRTRDIALFESAIIDEYGMFFHGQEAKKFRELYRNNLEYNFDTDMLKMYRFFQNATAYSYVSRGQCSETWNRIGTNTEILKHRKEILDDRKKHIRKIVSKVQSPE